MGGSGFTIPQWERKISYHKERFNRLAAKSNIGVNGKGLSELSDSCGMVAIRKILGRQNYDSSFLEDLITKDKSHCIDLINSFNSTGLGIMDIIKTVMLFNDNYSDGSGRNLVPDMRYNSHVRDLTGNVFRTGHTGIAALKFLDTNATHWIQFGDVGSNVSIEFFKRDYPKLDGIGHVVVFRHKNDIQAIANTHSHKCGNAMCHLCCRNDFCFEKTFTKQETPG